MFQKTEQTILKVENVSKLISAISNITEQNKINTKKTAILIDLDLTIFDRDGIMSDLYPVERKKFIETLGKIDSSLVELAYAQAPYHLIEEDLAIAIQKLQEQGFIVLGLTSRRTGKAKMESTNLVEEDACSSLKKLGISFSPIENQEFDIPEGSCQLENPNLLPYALVGKPKIFGNSFGASTIFTANYPKGLIIEEVIRLLKIEQIIGIDDNLKYLGNEKETCEKNKLPFWGLHYTYAQDHKKELNHDAVDIQIEHLKNHKELLPYETALHLQENSKQPVFI